MRAFEKQGTGETSEASLQLCGSSDFGLITVDEELAAKFNSESSLEDMRCNEMPPGLREFLDNSFFKVLSRSRTQRNISLENSDRWCSTGQ